MLLYFTVIVGRKFVTSSGVQGRVVRKAVNVNPGLNVIRSIIFFWLKKCFSPLTFGVV